MELIELINLLPQDNKDLVYKAYKIWFKILYEEYDYNESLVTEFIYDLFNQGIRNTINDFKDDLNVEGVYSITNSSNDIIYKWSYSINSKCAERFINKLNDFINEYQ